MMIVTKIEDRNRLVIVTVEQNTFRFHRDIFNELNIKEGSELSEETLKEYLDKEAFYAIELKLISLLRIKDYSVQRARQMLTRSFSKSSEIIEIIIKKYQDKGYLDDKKNIRTYIDKSLRKYWGLDKIRFELENAGYQQEMIDELITDEDIELERSLAYEFAKKNVRRYRAYISTGLMVLLITHGYDKNLAYETVESLGFDFHEYDH